MLNNLKQKRILWVVPDTRGGIRAYAEELWPVIQAEWERNEALSLPILYPDLVDAQSFRQSLDEIEHLKPDLIHVHHEYGLFGRTKNPPFYHFPFWIEELRARLPGVQIVATAHSVLDPQYRYPYGGRSWEIPFRWLANHTVLPCFQKVWTHGTWSLLDGVIVHSALQQDTVLQAGTKCQVIPLFVPEARRLEPLEASRGSFPEVPKDKTPVVMVFGYLTPDKGQDIVIEALAKVSKKFFLILAGGVRIAQDEKYARRLNRKIKALGLSESVWTTGYVPAEDVDPLYACSDLVIAPFRSTTGSASLVQAFCRGKAVLASDLPLNRELAQRVPGCLEFFMSENPVDLSEKIESILWDSERKKSLSMGASQYAEKYSLQTIVTEHCKFYEKIMDRVPL